MVAAAVVAVLVVREIAVRVLHPSPAVAPLTVGPPIQKAKEQARKDIDDARKAGTISENDEQQMMLAPYKYPTRLASTVAHLTLEDALDVYSAAGVQEKRDIRSEIAKKVTSYYASVTSGKRTEKEYKALKPKIDKSFKDRL